MDDELEEIRAKKLNEIKKSMTQPALPDTPVVLTDDDIDGAIASYPKLVVDCWAVWCGPCRMVAPTIEALAKEKAGNVVFAKLDIDRNPQTAIKYTISAVPTMLVFKNGRLAGRVLGALPKPQLDKKITDLLS